MTVDQFAKEKCIAIPFRKGNVDKLAGSRQKMASDRHYISYKLADI
jgi:hypothetical protein